MRYLEENAGAADLELSEDVLTRLDEMFAPENVAGERYAPELMRFLDRD